MADEKRPPGDEGPHVGQTDRDRNDERIVNNVPGQFHVRGATATPRTGSARDEIEVGAALLFGAPDRVVELRALGVRGVGGKGVVSGYFTDKERFIEAALKIDGRASGVYATMNIVNPALLARANNRLVQQPAHATCASDILRRAYLLIDADPRRPSGISATATELAQALATARAVVDFLTSLGFPEPAIAMSGNGGHALYAIDVPTDDGGLITEVLRALAFRFNTDTVAVDESVASANQLAKLYGTQACKGDPTEDRPHRRSWIRLPQGGMTAVSAELLRKVASLAPRLEPKAGTDASGKDLDIDGLLNRAGIEVEKVGEWSGGRRWVLKVCPFNPEHQDSAAYVVRLASGALAAGCHHNGCQGRGWHDLRDRIDPGWRERASRTSAGYAGAQGGRFPPQWREPKPIQSDLLPVPEFRPELLPPDIRGWIVDVTERVQCPMDYPAIGVVIGLGALVGLKVAIRPKRFDDWTVVPNLWGGIVGRPSTMKTPALQEALKPLRIEETDAQRSYRLAKDEYQAEMLVWDAGRKKLERGLSEDEAPEKAKARILQMLDQKPKAPSRPRLIVNDTSFEKLGEILSENPNGVLVFRDELVGLLRSLDKEGREEARAFYLEGWDGKGSFVFDRITRGTVELPHVVLSILGGIQPGPLMSYIADAIRAGIGDDGLMQRFQVMAWPNMSTEWRNVDRWPDSPARRRAHAVFTRVSALDVRSVGAEIDNEDPNAIPFLRFTAEAQERFDHWREALEHYLRSGADHEALESHFGKYRSLIPSLALIFQLTEREPGAVGLNAIEAAIAWGEYLEAHARRIYGAALNSTSRVARLLATRIKSGKLRDGFTAREVYQSGWAGLTDADQVARAAALLVDLDWLAEVEERTGGRPRTRFLISPLVLKTGTGGTGKTGESTTAGTSGGFGGSDQGASSAGTDPDGWEDLA
jgi:hypothetical protein